MWEASPSPHLKMSQRTTSNAQRKLSTPALSRRLPSATAKGLSGPQAALHLALAFPVSLCHTPSISEQKQITLATLSAPKRYSARLSGLFPRQATVLPNPPRRE